MVIAHYIGQKSEKNIHAAVHTAIVVAILSGVFVMILGQFIAKPVLLLMGTPGCYRPCSSLPQNISDWHAIYHAV